MVSVPNLLDKSMYRLLFRAVFIVLTLLAIVYLWQTQTRVIENQYIQYTQQLGERVSNISAGTLSPWLIENIDNQQANEAQLQAALENYLTMGDFKGIRLFDRFGVTLASVGEYPDIQALALAETVPYTVYVSPISHNNETIGYIRFVIRDDILNQTMLDLSAGQNLLIASALVVGMILGVLCMRLYYLSARRLYKKQKTESSSPQNSFIKK